MSPFSCSTTEPRRGLFDGKLVQAHPPAPPPPPPPRSNFIAGSPKADILLCLLLVVLFFLQFILARFIAVVPIVSVLYVILALWPPAFQHQLPALLFVCVLFVLFLLFVVVFLVNQNRTKARFGRREISSSAPPSPRPSVISLLAVPRRLFCFGSLVILDVACYGYSR